MLSITSSLYNSYGMMHEIYHFFSACPFQIQTNIKTFNDLICKLMSHLVERCRQFENLLVIALIHFAKCFVSKYDAHYRDFFTLGNG